MRKWMLRWLGIDEVRLRDLMRTGLDGYENDLGKFVRKEIKYALDATAAGVRYPNSELARYGGEGTGAQTLAEAIRENARDVGDRVGVGKGYLASEEFIDSVVERINRKQVGGKR